MTGSLTRRWLLALGAGVLALLLTEGLLRLLDLPARPPRVFEATADGSFRLVPDLDVQVEGPRGPVRVRTDPRGWRRVGATDPTVALLGDSFAFGAWATDGSRSMAGVANEITGGRVETYGVPGFGYDEHLAVLEGDVLPRRPRLVLLVSYMGNDLTDVWLGPQRYETDGYALRERVAIVRERIPAPWRRRGSPGQDLRRRAGESIRLVRLLGRAVSASRAPPTHTHEDYSSDLFWSRPSLPGWGEEALLLAGERLEAMARASEAAGARFVVLTLPYRQQVQPEGLPDGLDVREPQGRVAALAADREIPFLDLTPILRDAARDGPVYLPHDGHLNDHGHRVVGEVLAGLVLEHVGGR